MRRTDTNAESMTRCCELADEHFQLQLGAYRIRYGVSR